LIHGQDILARRIESANEATFWIGENLGVLVALAVIVAAPPNRVTQRVVVLPCVAVRELKPDWTFVGTVRTGAPVV